MHRGHLLLTALLLALSACRPDGAQELEAPVVLEAPVPPWPGAFSLSGGPAAPYLAYTDRDSRALVLAAADGSDPPVYLDRITDLPEQDPLAGAHLLFADGEDLHLLYLDRQPEDILLLKYVRKGKKPGTTWIDMLPAGGIPVAAFALSGGGLELYVERDQALFRDDPGAAGQPLRAPFRSQGRAAQFSAEGLRGFTVFDAATHRLLLFRITGLGLEQSEVARFGEAQDSAIDPEGRLQVLAYDPRTNRILLYVTPAGRAADFRIQPVTLSRGTHSVALVPMAGGTGFLFDELSARGQRRYQVSLLHPSPTGAYLKTILYRSESPIAALRATPGRDELFVALLGTSLRVLRVEYRELRSR